MSPSGEIVRDGMPTSPRKRSHRRDTVADRSEYIKKAAESEARKINSAYETIRAERNFS
jgi:hypothetical protein